MTVQIRRDISVENVYKQAKEEKTAKIRARILAIAAVLENKSRSYAAKVAGITINNMRSWVVRFNESGFDGLIDKKAPGNTSTWTAEVDQYLKIKVEQGANFEKDKRVVYRLSDFREDLKGKFGIDYGISTIWYRLKELKFSWITARQQHPKSDLIKQEAFKKKRQKQSKKFNNKIQPSK